MDVSTKQLKMFLIYIIYIYILNLSSNEVGMLKTSIKTQGNDLANPFQAIFN